MTINNNLMTYQKELGIFFDELSFRKNLFVQFKKQADKYLASDFNIFNVIDPDEPKLSDILANILNTNGYHGQGIIFLEEFVNFISERGLEVPFVIYDVHREVSANGRIDLLLESDSFAIIIENKPFAQDLEDQLNRYYEAMKQKHGEDVAVVYLNKNRKLPQNFSSKLKKRQLTNLLNKNKLLVISYLELKDYLTICYQKCDSNKFRYFLSDFIDYIIKKFPIIEGVDNDSDE